MQESKQFLSKKKLFNERDQCHESCALNSNGNSFLTLNWKSGVVTWNDSSPLGNELTDEPDILVISERLDLVGESIFAVLVCCHKRVELKVSRKSNIN